MKLKSINKNGFITLNDYSEEECRDILLERNSYVLRCIHSYGEDYGGSQCTDNREVTYEEIITERVLVKDGHFCGVCMYSDYKETNVYCNHTVEEIILYADGKRSGSARIGFSFSNDDHSRWNYVDYYLIERDEAPKEQGRDK